LTTVTLKCDGVPVGILENHSKECIALGPKECIALGPDWSQ